MKTVFPEDFVRRTSFRFRILPIAAQIALALAGLYLVQLGIYLATGQDHMGNLLRLQGFPFDPWSFVQVASYGAVHQIDNPMHVTLNCIVLWIFGLFLEQERGRRAVLASFVSGVVVGGFVFWAVAALSDDPNPVVGASGGVMAIVLATAVTMPNMPTFLRMPLWVLAAIYVGLDVVGFGLSLRGAGGSIAHTAHLGGAFAGLVIGFRARRHPDSHRTLADRFGEALERRREASAKERGEKLDHILEKIHEHGMESLSGTERRFLKQASKAAKQPSARSGRDDL